MLPCWAVMAAVLGAEPSKELIPLSLIRILHSSSTNVSFDRLRISRLSQDTYQIDEFLSV
jgi:hypothetical protein